jgi:hypothetical protein
MSFSFFDFVQVKMTDYFAGEKCRIVADAAESPDGAESVIVINWKCPFGRCGGSTIGRNGDIEL